MGPRDAWRPPEHSQPAWREAGADHHDCPRVSPPKNHLVSLSESRRQAAPSKPGRRPLAWVRLYTALAPAAVARFRVTIPKLCLRRKPRQAAVPLEEPRTRPRRSRRDGLPGRFIVPATWRAGPRRSGRVACVEQESALLPETHGRPPEMRFVRAGALLAMPNRSLMRKSFWLLWVGELTSRFGDGFFFIAMGWLVYADTGSPLAIGLLVFLRLVATSLVRLLAAPLTDRVDRRRLMMTLDGGRALLLLVPLALATRGLLQTWELFAIQVVASILATPYTAAQTALVADLAPRIALPRANALLTGGLEAMYLVGPAVGGLFIAHYGAVRSIAADGASFALCAGALALIPSCLRGNTRNLGPRIVTYGQALSEGWTLLRRQALLWSLTGIRAVSGSTDMVFGVLMIPLVRTVYHGGAGDVGFLEASLSAGVILASLVSTRKVWDRRPSMVLVGVPIFCLATAALAICPNIFWAVALQVVAGLSVGVFDVRIQTAFQSVVEGDQIGRTVALRDAMGNAFQSGSALLAGALAVGVGVTSTFGVFGILGAAVSAGLILRASSIARTGAIPDNRT